jgi:hypothetical protein
MRFGWRIRGIFVLEFPDWAPGKLLCEKMHVFIFGCGKSGVNRVLEVAGDHEI